MSDPILIRRPLPTASLRRFSCATHPLVRLVCFSWCGGGASVYRKLALSLPQHVEMFAVQLPGREERFGERRLTRMAQIIAMLIDEIDALTDLPLALFGHSMGALVAYEIAQALRARQSTEPTALIVSGHGAPHSRDFSGRSWHTANEDEFLANIRQLGGTPPELLEDREMMTALVPVLKADYEILETYLPSSDATLSCPLFACAGDTDNEVDFANLSAWSQYSRGRFSLHWFKGGHFYLNSQPRTVARRIEQWLAETLEPARIAPESTL
jgi:surfactin synthase thioesterase subunit